jgi:hypothetical protein
MVERPIKKSDLPPPEETPKTDRSERKGKRNRDRKEKQEEKKPPIPPALVRGPKPQPKKPVVAETGELETPGEEQEPIGAE